MILFLLTPYLRIGLFLLVNSSAVIALLLTLKGLLNLALFILSSFSKIRK
jgi:hypothetical protein